MSAALPVLLSPRPYAKSSGKLLLLPLLPSPTPLKSLPVEIWSEIVAYVLLAEGISNTTLSLLRICRGFTAVALPLIYSTVTILHVATLEKFQQRLHVAEQKWDSLRRIPYSTPGRWVQTIDLSKLAFTGQAQALQVDTALTNLFPLTPFLARFSLNPSFVLSRRALTSFADRDGIVNLRTLEGVSYTPTRTPQIASDPMVKLLQACLNIEELEVHGQGLDPAYLDVKPDEVDMSVPNAFAPLNLPKLHTLTLLSMHSSSLLLALLSSSLPSLRKLTLTPYDDVPYPSGLTTRFISIHGNKLRSLLLFTPKFWPRRLHPSPNTLLTTCFNLRHLSLEIPLPKLQVADTHPLQILSIPRPNEDFWRDFQKIIPQLPRFCMIRIRDVRWLRKGMNSRAQVAGAQGEMREWQKRLSRYQIRLVDADWNDGLE